MNILKISLKLLVPVLIGFITLEAGIRIIHKVILDNNSPQYSQYAEIFSDERDTDYLFWHKPNVNWKLTDGYYDFTFITNFFDFIIFQKFIGWTSLDTCSNSSIIGYAKSPKSIFAITATIFLHFFY